MAEPSGEPVGPRPTFAKWALVPVGGSVAIWAASLAVLAQFHQQGKVLLPTLVVVTTVYPILLAWGASRDGTRGRTEPSPGLGVFPFIWIGVAIGFVGFGAAFYLIWAGIYFEILTEAGSRSKYGLLFFAPIVLGFPVLGSFAGSVYSHFLAPRVEIDPDAEVVWRRAHRWGGALTAFLMLVAFALLIGLLDSGTSMSHLFAPGVGAVTFSLLPHSILSWRCYRRRVHPRTLIEAFD